MNIDTPAKFEESARSVAVFGAGIAGLTAAHELAEHGFAVTVFEPNEDERPAKLFPKKDKPPVKLGGMAASQWGFPESEERGFHNTPGTLIFRTFREGETSHAPPADYLPGEHGFRFFPAYYLHIWDLMQRTPIYEVMKQDGTIRYRPTHRTVFDNVQRVIAQGTTTSQGDPNLIFSRAAPRSIAEFVTTMLQIDTLGFTAGDMNSFGMRLARYMAMSPERRRREMQRMSAYDFFIDRDPDTGERRIFYSPAFEKQLTDMPKVLAAFDSRWGDARTNIDTYLQLQLRMDRRDNKADGVLNGPTSEAWFDHWYRHLRTMNVSFEQGGLDRLEFNGKDVYAILDDDDETEVHATYIVVATDAYTAERVTEKLRNHGIGGTVEGLNGYATSRPVDQPPFRLPWKPTAAHMAESEGRDPFRIEQVGTRPWDRFQTLSGIQYYFDTEFQLVRGHIYFTGSRWGLSSINQAGLWQDQPFVFRASSPEAAKIRTGYSGIMSVDIGDWRTPCAEGGPVYRDADFEAIEKITGTPVSPEDRDELRGTPKPAIHCTDDEIAREVWRQMVESLGNSESVPAGQIFPEPLYYTLDRNLIVTEDGYVESNLAPYLVPIVNDWGKRPGGPPWNPHGTSTTFTPTEAAQQEAAAKHYWEAAHGGYQVHGNTLVFAGVWAKTFTRMTSMEAACESGRHAVNAILDHFIYKASGEMDKRAEAETGLTWQIPYGFLDQGGSSPVRQPTVAGDYCFIYNIENREPSEFRETRLLDAEMVKRGLPHPWQTLGLDVLARGGNIPIGDVFKLADIGRLTEDLQQWRTIIESMLGAVPTGASADSRADSGQSGDGGGNSGFDDVTDGSNLRYVSADDGLEGRVVGSPTVVGGSFLEGREIDLPQAIFDRVDIVDRVRGFPTWRSFE